MSVFPALRVDHASIAVPAIAPALGRLRRLLPIRMWQEARPGYDDQFTWADFFIGDFKLELIESARPGSFVERFLTRHGEGFHHLSIEVEEGRLDGYLRRLEADGLRIVDRGDYGNGDVTAFISPRTAPGILVQFWQVPGFHGARPPEYPSEPVVERDGVRFRVAHLGISVRSIDAALTWFRRCFPVEVTPRRRPGGGAPERVGLRLARYQIELLEAGGDEGFHHLAVEVGDLDRLVAQLAAERIEVTRRSALDGEAATALIHPRDAHGVLLELREDPQLGRA